MKIWSLEEDVNHYEHITLAANCNMDWIDFGDMFNGNYLNDTWNQLQVELIQHDGSLSIGDMPYLSPGKPVFSEFAVRELKDFLNGNTEILALACDTQKLFIINVINQLDAIDYSKSDIEYGRDKTRILSVNRFSFKPQIVKNQHIFKIKNQLFGTVFVSDEFRNRVLESGLKGFKFVEVWDSND